MSEAQRECLTDNFVDDTAPVDGTIQKRQFVRFYGAGSRWGRGVAERTRTGSPRRRRRR